MKTLQFFCWLLIGCAVCTGCTPSLTPPPLDPEPQNTIYQQALRTLGRAINAGGEPESLFVVDTVENHSGKKDVPPDITNMVITSVSHLARTGDAVKHAFYDPETTDYKKYVEEYGFPCYILSGAISEFDQELSIEEHGFDLNFFLSPEIEDEIVDFDANVEFSQAKTVSRIAIDFHLREADTNMFVSEVNCSNSILLYDIEKDRQWRFIIHGSGLLRWGKIRVKHGAHEAIRLLTDYSMLQLFGNFYELPYWRALGETSPEIGREILSMWRQEFRDVPQEDQIFLLQMLLRKYPLQEVFIQGVFKSLDDIETEMIRFKLTEQTLDKMRNEHLPDNMLENLRVLENYGFFSESELLGVVEELIGKEQTVHYKELILKHSKFDQFGKITRGFVITALRTYAPQSTRLIQFAEGLRQYPNLEAILAAYPDFLADLYLTLIQHFPMNLPVNLSYITGGLS